MVSMSGLSYRLDRMAGVMEDEWTTRKIMRMGECLSACQIPLGDLEAARGLLLADPLDE